MTWMSLKNGFSQVLDSAEYYVGACARETGARLTQVAKAVYAREPVKHFCEGASQILPVPAFVSIAKQTQSLVLRSLKTNILFYLIPAILIPRFVPAVRQTDLYELMPSMLEYGLQKLDIILFVIMIRMFLRRQENNLKFAIAYPRVIKNDVEKLLPQMLSQELANEFVKVFNHLFEESNQTQIVQDSLLLDLRKLFERFFMKSSISAELFGELQEPLREIFESVLNTYYPVDIAKFHTQFSRQLADEFIKLLAKDFQSPDVPEKKPAKDELFDVLVWKFRKDESKQYAGDIRERLLQVKTKVQAFLPVVYYPPCQCKETNVIAGTTYPSFEYYRKTALAELSYGPYNLGNTLFTYAPSLLYSNNVISPEVFFWMQLVGFLARALLAGFYQNGLRMPSHCTRHRTEENNRHRLYASGVGFSQFALTEPLAQFILFTTGIRNFCTDDAIAQMAIQIMTIATLANNHRLPGTEKYPWNVFYFSQRATRALLNKVNSFLASLQQSPDELIANIKYVGNILKVFAWLIWAPGSIFPAKPTDENKQSLLQNESMHYIFKLFRRDMQAMLDYVENARTVSSWITRPASWVAPSIFVTCLVIASKVLNDATLIALLVKIKAELKKIELEEVVEIQAIEDANVNNPENVNVELTPAILDVPPPLPVPVPMVTYQKDEKSTLEAEIAKGILTDLRDVKPLAVIPEKKPVDMIAAISTESYFKQPVKEQKKQRVMADGFELIEPIPLSVSSAAYQRNALLGNKNLNRKPVIKPKTTWALPQLKLR